MAQRDPGSANHLPLDDGRGDSSVVTTRNVIFVITIATLAIVAAVALYFLWPRKAESESMAAPPVATASVAEKTKATEPTSAQKAEVKEPMAVKDASRTSSSSKKKTIRQPVSAVSGPCSSSTTGKPFQWRVSGANPYARSETEAFSDAKLDRMLECNGIPRAEWAEIKRQLRAAKGELVVILPGESIGNMMFGAGRMVTNVISQIKGGQRALRFHVSVGGKQYTFLLPLECWNWTLMPPPAPPPCYRIYFDYSGQQGVVPVNDSASVSGHFPLTMAQTREVVKDECTFVQDADGRRKPGLGPCTVNCPPQGGWPPGPLAAAVGLPPDRLPSGEPHGEINFKLKRGKGFISLPADVYWKMVYCVLVTRYPVSAEGYEGWAAVTRFDTVTKTDLKRTRPAGKLDRTLKGASSY
ncbi:MAG TPA: hypothetical protein VFY28_02440 [Candidatus Paceibacterota bacterium]|nr:hypothetical protein [Candidatus Paceibacterota bacterium]